MMKLKHLFDNRDLALMILENWAHEEQNLDLMNRFRISANAVYPFRTEGGLCFLRFAPEEEKAREDILAELAFLRYLREAGYPAAATVPSKRGAELETVETPWGLYYAVAFRGVAGVRLDRVELKDEIIFGLGQALGRLHRLCRDYAPAQYKRPDHAERIQWMEKVLSGFPDERAARKEAEILFRSLAALPMTKDDYGLIHYDFETDNVFYDAADSCYSVIDFDDCVYHWYAADAEQSLDSLGNDLPEERKAGTAELFVAGYRAVMPIAEEMLGLRPIFRRYADLYGYVRILRSVAERWEHEPEWMRNLRVRLRQAAEHRAREFGKPLIMAPKTIGLD